jgi:hypothetical protein
VLPTRQHHLVAVHGARSGTADRDPSTPEGQLAGRVPVAICFSTSLAGVGWPADGGPFVLEQLLQGGHPRVHHEGVEVTANNGGQSPRDRHSDGLFTVLLCYFLHRRFLSGCNPIISIGPLGTATSNFNRDRDYARCGVRAGT